MRRAGWILLAALCGTASWTSPLAAKEPTTAELAQARDLFTKAERDERSGDWRAALEKLERAGAVKMTPGIRFHIALCRENLGELVEALAQYELATQQARDAGNREVLEAAQEPLADLRARVPSLVLSLVNAAADDVEITVDRRPLAPSDLGTQLRVAPGPHAIVAKRKSDGQTFSKELTLKERETLALDLKLPAKATNAGAAPAPATTPAPAPAPGSNAAVVEPPREAPKPSRTGAIIATASAVVLVGGGVGAFVLAGGKQDDLAKCNSVASCDDSRSAVRTFDAVALGAFIGGAAASALAIVFWLDSPKAPRAAATSSRWSVSVGPGSASVAGRF